MTRCAPWPTTLPEDRDFTAALRALVDAEGRTEAEVIRMAVLERYQRMCLMSSAPQTEAAIPAARAEQMRKVLERLGSV